MARRFLDQWPYEQHQWVEYKFQRVRHEVHDWENFLSNYVKNHKLVFKLGETGDYTRGFVWTAIDNEITPMGRYGSLVLSISMAAMVDVFQEAGLTTPCWLGSRVYKQEVSYVVALGLSHDLITDQQEALGKQFFEQTATHWTFRLPSSGQLFEAREQHNLFAAGAPFVHGEVAFARAPPAIDFDDVQISFTDHGTPGTQPCVPTLKKGGSNRTCTIPRTAQEAKQRFLAQLESLDDEVLKQKLKRCMQPLHTG